MVAHLYRPLTIGLLPIVLVACVSSGSTLAREDAPVPLGIDLGGSGSYGASRCCSPARRRNANGACRSQ